MTQLSAPFPWFGGKRRVAAEVWARFGDVANYVEPFFGSGAVLLGRERWEGKLETVNDLDGFVANFWRAVKHSPAEVAEWADNPVNENDLHARHAWLVERRESLRERLEADPECHDARIAGYWVWGLNCWIGSGFCSGRLGRQRPNLTHHGQGTHAKGANVLDWLGELSNRLRRVRVCSGDWSRVLGDTVTDANYRITGIFLDPPYADAADRAEGLYRVDSLSVAHAVREWAIANGDRMRIALCGYEDEHTMPEAWAVHRWDAGSSFTAPVGASQGKRERIWFSPLCLSSRQASLFAGAAK